MSKCDYICARDLHHKVTIQAVTVTQDSFGQPTETWAAWGTAWANIKQLSGRELVNAQQVKGDVTHEFRIRYRDGVTVRQRLSFDGRTFGILNVNNVNEADVELRLLCKEIA